MDADDLPDDHDARDADAPPPDVPGEVLLGDTIALLDPAEPICLPASATVAEAIERMLARRQAGVLVVDCAGRLTGIFTERDVLTRVVGAGRDPAGTHLEAVMTRDPEALRPGHRIAYAIHCMSVAGYRTVPLVDEAGRPTGVVTSSDVIRWLGGLFPEAVLNLPPGGLLKHPQQIDAG
ncbi:MAG TPA: CBS domain-containing protein [Candidatus Tectomicrobia bacterium]|nr:CBS domain-containing protein [Candidatus Tectomicrobia bacterium]